MLACRSSAGSWCGAGGSCLGAFTVGESIDISVVRRCIVRDAGACLHIRGSSCLRVSSIARLAKISVVVPGFFCRVFIAIDVWCSGGVRSIPVLVVTVISSWRCQLFAVGGDPIPLRVHDRLESKGRFCLSIYVLFPWFRA